MFVAGFFTCANARKEKEKEEEEKERKLRGARTHFIFSYSNGKA